MTVNGMPGAGAARRRWSWLRAGVLTAALVGTALVATACSSGTHTSAPPTSQSMAVQLDLYAACMRSHGVTDFYFTKESDLAPDTPAINIGGEAVPLASVHAGSPTYKAASSACEDKLPGGPPAPMTEAQKEAALRQAACIRAHGFPTYPDPVFPAGGGVKQQPALGIDVNSPQFQKAMQDCSK
jgi:hypothetical protein